ncbi:OmpA family protein [Rhodoferax aquaticus]|uniref:DUF4398 domain-containing protein n=1 Tax=Rhodoferax aquaticus TaxID=2527691 RepID=A0A515EM36_9BURK|nr:OmpA family protein [Rhodoferax aquaticus]QDL53704.1 DUF4398 domain-containing protein [Rhodoferax aquaticus]
MKTPPLPRHLTTRLAPIALALAAFLGACSSLPNNTTLLEQTRMDYRVAVANPDVATYAPLEMKLASDALSQANTAAMDRASAEDIDKLAYLAKQRIGIAQALASQKAAEAQVANASKVRDQVLLQQRTVEADQAKADAAIAQARADRARLDTQQALDASAAAQNQAQNALDRNALLERQLAALAAQKTERGFVITLSDVLFGTDLARLNGDGIRTAQKLANILQENPQRRVLIEGFADSTGSSAHNQELSERRANAVMEALQNLGIPAGRIDAKGYGEAYPVAANDTAPQRQRNRRVEIVLSDESGRVPPR